MSQDDDPTRRRSNPMGQKPRVPVGPRREAPSEVPPTRVERQSRPTGPTRRQRTPAPLPSSGTSARKAPAPVVRTRAELIRRIVLIAAAALIGLGMLGSGVFFALYRKYSRDLPDVHHLQSRWRPMQTTRVMARNGEPLAELYIERRTVVSMDHIPGALVRAVLAAEDAEFYVHHGLDLRGMARALMVDVLHGSTVQGASTITQQVVKNVLLTPERTLSRKFRELILARRIEAELSKNDILYLYLNDIAFGHGRNGVEEAARFYFGKHVDQLTLSECALLAAIPKSPTHYSPRLHPDAALTRRNWIIGRMVANRFISQADADGALAEPIRLSDAEDESEGSAPEVIEAVREALRQSVGDDALRAGGFTVTTTIDPALQREARSALQASLRDLDTRQGYFGPLLAPGVRRVRGRPGYVLPGEAPPDDGRLMPGRIYGGLVESTVDPDSANHRAGSITVRVGDVRGVVPWSSVARYVREDTSPSTFAPQGAVVRVSVDRAATRDAEVPMRLELGPDGALVAIDPATREVRALVGGYEPLAGMFDRASHALRQPGSSFKPFLYSYALSSRRYTLASTVDPNPACFGQWCPHEAHAGPPGSPPEPPMRLRDALAFSRNMVAARVVTDVGPQALADHARQIGIQSRLDPVPSLALGTSEVTPLEMTNAYATWDAQGTFATPVLIQRIQGPDGRDIPLPTHPERRQALPPEESWLVTSLMTSVIETPHGTGNRAQELRRPVAGKTGTSNEVRDAWFIGFTPDLVCGVWVGFDDRQPLGRGEEGARSALPAWLQFMRRYIAIGHPPPLDFPRPAAIVTARIDPTTGLLARPDQTDAVDEYFLAGTQPQQIAVPVGSTGATNWFTGALTGGDGGIAVEAPEPPPGPAPSEPPATLPTTLPTQADASVVVGEGTSEPAPAAPVEQPEQRVQPVVGGD